MILNNVRCNTKAIDHDTALSKQQVSPVFEDVFPIFIACEVVIFNIAIEELQRLEQWING